MVQPQVVRQLHSILAHHLIHLFARLENGEGRAVLDGLHNRDTRGGKEWHTIRVQAASDTRGGRDGTLCGFRQQASPGHQTTKAAAGINGSGRFIFPNVF